MKFQMFLITIIISSLLINLSLASYPLDTACGLPKALGGNGTCSPFFCSSITNSYPACTFANTTYVAINYTL